MKDLYLDNFYKLDLYGKSSKKPYNRGKSFGYQVLGFGSGVAAGGLLPLQKGIFPFGTSFDVPSDTRTYFGTSNIVNDSGVIQSDTSAVGSARAQGAGATFGGDKGIHAFGDDGSGTINTSNLISNEGVVGSDVTGVGTARLELSAVSYGSGNALFAFGTSSGGVGNIKNLVSNAGVVATDSSGVGTNSTSRMECSFGGVSAGTAIIAFGSSGKINLVSDVGVIASDTNLPGGASSHTQGAGCTFGDDQGIMGYGSGGGQSNIISNTGGIASDVSRVGLFRISLAACSFGGDKGIFAFGDSTDGDGARQCNVSNLVSNSGVIASDVINASATAKSTEQACSFGN